jgi:hypothetical protein
MAGFCIIVYGEVNSRAPRTLTTRLGFQYFRRISASLSGSGELTVEPSFFFVLVVGLVAPGFAFFTVRRSATALGRAAV